MQQSVTLNTRRERLVLNTRRKRLRLTMSGLARLADLDRATVTRALHDKADVLASTVAKIETALVAEERRVVGAILEEGAGSPRREVSA